MNKHKKIVYFILITAILSIFISIFISTCTDPNERINPNDSSADPKYRIMSLLEPTNTSPILYKTPTFRWTGIKMGASYELQIAITPFEDCTWENGHEVNCQPKADEDIIDVVHTSTITGLEYTNPEDLDYSKYYWRVRPITAQGTIGPWCVQKSWTFTIEHSSLTIPKYGAGIAKSDTHIYVIGGIEKNDENPDISGEASSLAHYYSMELNQWDVTLGLNTKRSFLTAEVNGQFLYIIGGKSSTNLALTDVSRILLTGGVPGGVWDTVNVHDMTNARAKQSSVIYSGKLYVFGGDDNVDAMTSCEVYDFKTNLWTDIEPLPAKRMGTAAVVFNDKIWVIGGADYKIPYNSIYIYDPTKNTWSTHPTGLQAAQGSFTGARAYLGAVVFNNKVWVIGGDNDDKYPPLQTVEICDESSCIDSQSYYLPDGEPYSKARSGFKAFNISDKIWCVGGETSDMIVFDINAEDLEGNKGIWMP